jgi:hypothetical protein
MVSWSSLRSKSIQSQPAPSSLSMLRAPGLHTQRVPTSLSMLRASGLHASFARFAPRTSGFYAHLRCSLRSPHSVDSTPFSGVSFPIQFQFLLRDPVPRQGFPDFCTERHFSARFRMGSRGHAQVADSDARAPVRSSRSRSKGRFIQHTNRKCSQVQI